MKSFHKLLAITLITALLGSCSTNSAASEQVHSDLLSDTYAYLSPEAIVYASSISNLIATFPKFRNDAVNREVSSLKGSLSDYLGAVREFNQSSKHRSLEDFEKYYEAVSRLPLTVILVGELFSMAVTSRRRAIHGYLAGSVVIRLPR